ncbi:MAG: M15 family metallopeptidase [Clostridia bacterium]|nr:M15 family metallopeptidase [Clostridia bacterium]
MATRRRKKRLSTKTKIARAVCVLVVLLLAFSLCFTAVSLIRTLSEYMGGSSSSSPSSDLTSAPSSDAPSSDPSSDQPSSDAPSSSEEPSSDAPSSEVFVPVDPSKNTGIYEGVTWRSPYAVPANVFKYGRDLMLVNREYELPLDFEWDLVRWSNGQDVDAMSLNSAEFDQVMAVDRAAYQPLKDMFAAAKAAGVPLQLVSPYRSIDKQDRLFDNLVVQYKNQGMSETEAVAKANTARTFTGTSEHNIGYGFDILEAGNWYLTESFEKTKQFAWLQEHAAEYGFILRYAKDKVEQTGIMYEPWHYRYVGVAAAKEITGLGMCLEEYIEYLDNDRKIPAAE